MGEITLIRPTRRWPAGTSETLIRLWNAGWSTAALAQTFGTTTRAIDSKVRKLRVAGHYLAVRRSRMPRPNGSVPRSCLYCGRLFASGHIGNRLCPACLEDGPFTSAMV